MWSKVENVPGNGTVLHSGRKKDSAPEPVKKACAASFERGPSAAIYVIPKKPPNEKNVRDKQIPTAGTAEPSPIYSAALQIDDCSLTHNRGTTNESTDWRTQKRRNRNNKNKLVGTSNADIGIKAAPKYAHLHVFRLAIGTTTDAVKNHLNNSGIKECEIEKLEPKYPKKYTSFKITVPFNLLEKINPPDIWPSQAVVQRFLFLRPKQRIET